MCRGPPAPPCGIGVRARILGIPAHERAPPPGFYAAPGAAPKFRSTSVTWILDPPSQEMRFCAAPHSGASRGAFISVDSAGQTKYHTSDGARNVPQRDNHGKFVLSGSR